MRGEGMNNRVTLELADGPVLYVRCHKTDEIPGEYENAFALECVSPGVWEAKIAMESMTLAQRRDFKRAVLDRGDIKKIVWARYVDGTVLHKETVFLR